MELDKLIAVYRRGLRDRRRCCETVDRRRMEQIEGRENVRNGKWPRKREERFGLRKKLGKEV